MKSEEYSSELTACRFTSSFSACLGGLRERRVIGGTMDEVARGVQTTATVVALAVALIPCEPVGFETCKVPEMGSLEAV